MTHHLTQKKNPDPLVSRRPGIFLIPLQHHAKVRTFFEFFKNGYNPYTEVDKEYYNTVTLRM